jgi:hypothetical protein
MLNRIEITHTPVPADAGNIVDLPGGIEKMRKTIIAFQKEARNAQQQRADYEKAWAAAVNEMEAAMQKNAVWQQDVHVRLFRLRTEWVNITEQLGIPVSALPPPQHGHNGGPPLEDEQR